MQLYIVPNSKDISPMASYLAKRDHIYQRLIFVPATVVPMYPLCTDRHMPEYQNRVKRSIDMFGNYFMNEPKRVLPFELLEANIQTYLGEANHFIKLNIYELIAKCRRFGDSSG